MKKTCSSCTIRAKKHREHNLWLLADESFDNTDSVLSNGFLNMHKLVDVYDSYVWHIGYGLYIDGIIITSTHIISDSISTVMELDMEILELDMYTSIIAYDIAIMKIKSKHITDTDVFNILEMIEFINFAKICKGMLFETFDASLSLTIDNICFAKLTSELCPQIPLLQCDIGDVDYTTLEGHSGSFVQKDGKIVGMITSIMNKKMEIVPFEVIKILITNFINTPPKVFPIDVSLCDVDINDSLCDVTCLYTNTQTINFNTNKKKNIGFKRGDVISNINGLKFTTSGELYCELLNCYTPYDTYLLLWGKDIEVSYCSPDDDKLKHVTIKQKNITDDIYSVHIYDSGTYYNYNGIIFTELSEQIIIYCKNNDIGISNEILTSYGKIISPNKIIIAVSVKNSNIKIKNQLVDHGVIKSSTVEQMLKYPILFKIGNKRIKNLNDICDTYSSVVTFINDDTTEFKLNVK